MRVGEATAPQLYDLVLYSLSDLVGLTAFPFFPQKNHFCLPNLANLLVALPHVCINILFVSTLQNVNFAH